MPHFANRHSQTDLVGDNHIIDRHGDGKRGIIIRGQVVVVISWSSPLFYPLLISPLSPALCEEQESELTKRCPGHRNRWALGSDIASGLWTLCRPPPLCRGRAGNSYCPWKLSPVIIPQCVSFLSACPPGRKCSPWSRSVQSRYFSVSRQSINLQWETEDAN